LVHVVEGAGEGLDRGRDLFAVPADFAGPEAVVALGAEGRGEDALEHVRGLETVYRAERQRRHIGALQGVAGGEEVIDADRVADLDAVILQHLAVVEHHVAAMDADRDKVLLAVDRGLLGEALGDRVVPAFLIPEVGDGLAEAGLDVAREELLAGVALPAVGRIAALEAGLQRGLRVRARAAGDRRVDDLDVRRGGRESIEQLFEAGGLGAGGPPGEDLELVFTALGCCWRRVLRREVDAGHEGDCGECGRASDAEPTTIDPGVPERLHPRTPLAVLPSLARHNRRFTRSSGVPADVPDGLPAGTSGRESAQLRCRSCMHYTPEDAGLRLC